MPAQNGIFAHALGFEWPNGTRVLEKLDFSLSRRRVGLVGDNGVGKTTLLNLILGKLEPTNGDLKIRGRVGYLAQMRDTNFEMSGGEQIRFLLTHIFEDQPDILILDEPTNDLDEAARGWVGARIAGFDKTALVVSHDPELLMHVDEIWELSSIGLKIYGGNFEFYQETRRAERDSLTGKLTALEATLRKVKTKAQSEREKFDRRISQGKKHVEKTDPDMFEKRWHETNGQMSADKSKKIQREKTRRILSKLELERQALIAAVPIVFDLPRVEISNGRTVLSLQDFNLAHLSRPGNLWEKAVAAEITGPRRVWLRGPNGSGKSSLLKAIIGKQASSSVGAIRLGVPTAYLDQNLSLVAEERTLLDQVRNVSGPAAESELRIKLARAGFPNLAALKLGKQLSGGERVRFALLLTLMRNPVPQLLLLDEPTNSLDLQARDELIACLNAYGGALIFVSHDLDFGKQIRFDRTWSISTQGLEV